MTFKPQFALVAKIVSITSLGVLLTQPLVQAATQTWDGNGNGGNTHLWSSAQNWVGSVPGAADIASFGTVASGESVTPLVNSAAAISNIVFNSGAATFTFGGTSVLTVGGSISNNSVATQTINTSLALARAQTWSANSGSLVFGGPINNAGFNLTIGGANNTTLSGLVNGAGGLIKSGDGTLSITRSNNFSGGLTVNGGKVLVSNTASSATGSGGVVVNAGTFGGSGRITGGLTLNSSGRVAAGDASGATRVSTLTTGNETWNGGSAMDWEIKDANGPAGTGWDLVAINGSLTLAASAANKFTVDVASLTLGNVAGNASNFAANGTYQWLIASATGGITGFDAAAFDIDTTDFSNPLLGSSQFLISLVDGGNGLAITYIPEPSTITLGLLGAGVIAGRFYTRRNRK